MDMLHRIPIPNGGSPSRGGQVAYYREGTTCVFSGIKGPTTTINAAEEIIDEICRIERVAPTDLTFFDLQTSFGYTYKPPGQYDFDQVTFTVRDRTIVNVDWSRKPCPPTVLQQFRRYLGSAPRPS